MPDWSALLSFTIDRGSATPLFRQIHDGLRRLILDGAAPPGSRLPATRLLSARLGVARSSVVAVYEQLLAEGHVDGRVGAGTFVAGHLPIAVPAKLPSAVPATLAAGDAAARRASFAVGRVVGQEDGSETSRAEGTALRPTAADGDAPAVARPGPAARYAALRPDPAQFSALPFNTGRCAVDDRTMAVWRRLTAARLRRPDPLWLGYADPMGSPGLREALAQYLRASRAVQCDPAQIMILSGTQQGMDLVLKTLLEPGDPVWIEDPTYPAMHAALRAAQAQVVPVPVDADGMVVQAGIAAAPHARAAYVTPSHQSPSGVVLSMARRLELLAWARDARAWIIEDDYDSEFRYAGRPLASLQGIDRGERVIYLGTFSKVLFPGLRLGYAVVPYELLDAMVAARHLTDRHSPGVTEGVVTDFIEQGHFGAHLRRMSAQYRASRDWLVQTVNERLGTSMQVHAPDQGMHVTARLRPGLHDVALAQAGAARGVSLRPLSPFYLATPPVSGLMLGFTGHDMPAMRDGLDRLAAAVAELVESRAGGPGKGFASPRTPLHQGRPAPGP